MRKVLQRAKNIAALLLMVGATCIVAVPHTAYAAAGNPSYCDSSVPRINNQDFGAEVPVIMVHGLLGNGTDWGSINNASSFAGRVNNIPDVAVAHRFDYDWSKWVTDPGNGPRLAKTIDCISQLSQHNGGKGKVIVVGYSMGGLMARDALSHGVDGRHVADEVDQVITIGTPHAGANASAWCGVFMIYGCKWFVPGSNEMTALPDFPSQTIVHTIAGDVTRVYHNQWGQEVKRERPYDDTLVPVNSAHLAYTIDADKGGGSTTFYCDKSYLTLGIFGSIEQGKANCEHGQLVQNASNGVREDTIAAIEKYVAWLNTPPVTHNSFTVGTITMTFDDRWRNVNYGASGPGEDLIGQDLTNGTACTNCSTTPPPTVYPSILVTNMASVCNDGRTMMECMTSSSWTDNQVGPAPDVTIGGRTPDSSLRFIQPGDTNASRMFWCFEAEKICIDYGIGADINLEPSAALLDVLHSATWSGV